MTGDEGWFAGIDPDDAEVAAARVREGSAGSPADWPARAVAAGVADDEADYYDRLKAATTAATRAAVEERERADDQQLIHAVRAMDDATELSNELAERVDEWAGSLGLLDGVDADGGIAAARELSTLDPGTPPERRVVSLARRARDLADERDDLRAFVETSAPAVAPNLAAMAGPVLAARLIALAGGLESLAKSASGTVQVLGAEDALFAHLRGSAPSPKHGVIYTHEYVRGTRPEDRGSAARAVAGKFAIAARVDHYSGERRPELDRELDARMARIRARADGNGGESADGGDSGESAGGDGGDDA